MTNLCAGSLSFIRSDILLFVQIFLWGAVLLAIIAAGFWIAEKAILTSKLKQASTTEVRGMRGLDASFVQALGTLITALVSAPIWFALFLAGVFLFWVAGDVSSTACRPPVSTTRSSTEKTVQTETTGTAPKSATEKTSSTQITETKS